MHMVSDANLNIMLCAPVMAGIGVEFSMSIVLTWTSELRSAAHRGKTFNLIFMSNYIEII